MLKSYGGVDSKFKFVLLASKRAKQLLRGAKPKVKSRSKSLIRIAQEEVVEGAVDYEIVQRKKEEEYRPEDENFIGEEIEVEKEASEVEIEKKPKKGKKEEGDSESKKEKKKKKQSKK